MTKRILHLLTGVLFLTITQVHHHPARSEVSRAKGPLVLSQWEATSASGSKISFRDNDPVIERRWRIDAERNIYSEAMRVPGGSFLFEWRKNSAAIPFDAPAKELIRRYGKSTEVVQRGFSIEESAIRTLPAGNGDASYIIASSAAESCIYFFQLANNGRADSALLGSICVQGSSSGNNALQQLNQILDQVVFDGGAIARSKLFDSAFAQIRQKEESVKQKEAPSKTGIKPQIELLSVQTTSSGETLIEGRLTAPGNTDLRMDGVWVETDARGQFKIKSMPRLNQQQYILTALTPGGERAEKTIQVTAKATALQQPIQPIQFGRNVALVIGNAHYSSPIPTLATPSNDAHSVADALSKLYGYEVRLLLDVRKGELIDAFNRLQAELGETDSLLVYYAGHGVADKETGKGYWLPVDARLDNGENFLPNGEVSALLRQVRARRVIIVSDSCFSGSLTQEQSIIQKRGYTSLRDMARLRSRTVLASSGVDEKVVDSFPGDTNSIFAKHFLKLLSMNDGILSGVQLSSLVRGLVLRDVRQTPQYGAIISAGHDEGADFIFRRL
ncbi:MAG: caspase family protein [Alphaproteobacteria bacterium]|nr:caspase family protein [Alphaproteobacteria bacterium]